MGYQAGNLELSLIGYSDKAVNSINATTKALGSLSRVIKKMEGVNFSFAGQKLEALFTRIARATNSINTTNITNLASAAKSLSSITRLSNLEKMDFEKVGKGFNTLAVAIQPFLDRVKEAEASLTALDGVLRHSSGRKIQGLLGGGNGNGNGGGFGFAKRFLSIYALRRMGHFMANLVQAGSDYNETLNLWQVAMRNNLDVADQFVNKMQKAYGISTKTLMNAQAIFKNMIGSLGQISDATAYSLSEALVQMSADFASLYNVTIESAFQKMQAMLAGQVRPIRSAGLDMTETTLFMFYQQLGGTKTMRQLNRTEKQLLSILAVYQQMGSAGALGDMSKTLNQFANQSRMMTEYWAELKTWTGLVLKDLIDQSGALIYINAALITITEVVKAIAKSRGLGDENFLTGMFETAEATNDAVDELQGKLLDFDKFRSLEGASTTPLAIDEKLLQAITGYSSKIDQAENKAQQLAETWTKFWVDQDGHLTKDGERFLGIFEGLVKFGTILVGLKIGTWIVGLVKGIGSITLASKGLHTVLVAGIIYAIWEAIDAFREGDYVTGILATTIGVVLVGALLKSKLTAMGATVELGKFYMTVGLLTVGITVLVSGISMFTSNFDKLSTRAKVWIPILASLAGVITAVAAGLTFMKGNWIGAIGLGATVAGIGLMVGTQLSIPNYEMGASDIDSGTVFRAGEFGKTEAVFTGSNGKTNVANVKQMRMAFLGALQDWTNGYLDDELEELAAITAGSASAFTSGAVYAAVKSEAKRRGEKFANV